MMKNILELGHLSYYVVYVALKLLNVTELKLPAHKFDLYFLPYILIIQ